MAILHRKSPDEKRISRKYKKTIPKKKTKHPIKPKKNDCLHQPKIFELLEFEEPEFDNHDCFCECSMCKYYDLLMDEFINMVDVFIDYEFSLL